jgi:sulfate adenylyltransferase subunit 1 (EFTu-like GTPase family)
MDLADFQRQKFDDTKRALEPFMKSAGLEVLSYIPISAVKGDNVAKRSKAMDWYEGPTLLECLDRLEGHPSTQDKPLIFPVQDVYRVDEMRIIVGRLEAGRIRAGETVKVLPSGRTAKISSIEKYPQKKVREAGTGESIGVTTEEDVFVDRGDVICLPGEEPFLTDKFSATIFWMAPEPLDTDERLVVRCATQETSCVIECVGKRVDSSTFEVIGEDSKTLKNLEVGEVVIKTKKPLAIKAFGDVRELGRFVLVRDQNICAGGIITEADGSL